jgi:hypothetical protein
MRTCRSRFGPEIQVPTLPCEAHLLAMIDPHDGREKILSANRGLGVGAANPKPIHGCHHRG